MWWPGIFQTYHGKSLPVRIPKQIKGFLDYHLYAIWTSLLHKKEHLSKQLPWWSLQIAADNPLGHMEKKIFLSFTLHFPDVIFLEKTR